jgi:hypothetical protein
MIPPTRRRSFPARATASASDTRQQRKRSASKKEISALRRCPRDPRAPRRDPWGGGGRAPGPRSRPGSRGFPAARALGRLPRLSHFGPSALGQRWAREPRIPYVLVRQLSHSQPQMRQKRRRAASCRYGSRVRARGGCGGGGGSEGAMGATCTGLRRICRVRQCSPPSTPIHRLNEGKFVGMTRVSS